MKWLAPKRQRTPLIRTAAASIVGLLLNACLLALALVVRGGLAELWRDPAVVTLFLLATAMVVIELTARGSSHQPLAARADHWPLRLAACTGLLLFGILWLALFEHRRHLAIGSWPIAGAILMASGMTLRLVAIRTLGQHFITEVAVRPGQPLFRSGIYRFLRHPSETGLLAIALGTCMLLSAPLSAGLWLTVLLPLIVLRISLEDRQLSLAFGQAFASYRKTKRLLPLIY